MKLGVSLCVCVCERERKEESLEWFRRVSKKMRPKARLFTLWTFHDGGAAYDIMAKGNERGTSGCGRCVVTASI
jgi:hypothetical protein